MLVPCRAAVGMNSLFAEAVMKPSVPVRKKEQENERERMRERERVQAQKHAEQTCHHAHVRLSVHLRDVRVYKNTNACI